MNKPKAVKPGDTLGLVGPSGAIRTDDGLERAIKVLKDFGYNVKVGASAGARYGYLSGTDELRAKDLNDMFMDDEVFCAQLVRARQIPVTRARACAPPLHRTRSP